MPGVPRQWLDGIVYMYESEESALRGDPVGGTGFVMSLDPSPGLPPAAGHLYIVTNAHIIEGGFTVPRVNRPSHGGFRAEPVGHWVPHPDGDDVAIAAVQFPGEVTASHVPFEMAVTPEVIRTEMIGPGDEAFFVGRYIYRDGNAKNTPTVRFGAIAQVDGDPIRQDRLSGRRYQQSFLVECHSLSGFSGSPVFAYRGARIHAGDDPNVLTFVPQVGQRVYLLGVDWGSDPWRAQLRDGMTDKPVTPPQYVSASSGMAMVVPAWKFRDILDEPILAEARQQREDAWREKISEEERHNPS